MAAHRITVSIHVESGPSYDRDTVINCGITRTVAADLVTESTDVLGDLEDSVDAALYRARIELERSVERAVEQRKADDVAKTIQEANA